MINNKNKNKPGVCFLLEDFYPVKHGATTQILLLGERLAKVWIKRHCNYATNKARTSTV